MCKQILVEMPALCVRRLGFSSSFGTASVPLDRGLGAAFVPEWYVMSAIAVAAEVNSWDLCHHLVTQGFSVAGLSAKSSLDLWEDGCPGRSACHRFARLPERARRVFR